MPKIFRFNESLITSRAQEACSLSSWQVGLPGVECDVCGNLWADSASALPNELPMDHPLRFRKPGAVPLAEFNELAASVRQALHFSDDFPLLPGTELGLTPLTCKQAKVAAFQRPYIQVLVVTPEVVEFLRGNIFTGWEAYRVEVQMKKPDLAPPELYRLFVTGRGGIAAEQPKRPLKFHCKACLLTRYENRIMETFELDTRLWDGSDIFKFDAPYHGFVFVTERLAEALRRTNFEGYRLMSVEEFIAQHNEFMD